MDYKKLAKEMIKFKKEATKNTLKSVIIKGKGEAYYFDTVTNEFILVKNNSEMYYLPIEEDERGRLSIFLPYIFNTIAIILVPKDDIIFIGYN